MIPRETYQSAVQTSDAWNDQIVTIWRGRTVSNPWTNGRDTLGYGPTYTHTIGDHVPWCMANDNYYPVCTILPYLWWTFADWRKGTVTR